MVMTPSQRVPPHILKKGSSTTAWLDELWQKHEQLSREIQSAQSRNDLEATQQLQQERSDLFKRIAALQEIKQREDRGL